MYRQMVGVVLLLIGFGLLGSWAVSEAQQLITSTVMSLFVFGLPACVFLLTGTAMVSRIRPPKT
jgi:hypothetical protein